jgi:hypothetical protein
MDDRDRALENDQRAKDSAPPEPDPTAIPDDANFRGLAPEGGFTGFEGLWDYIYWQTLSINMLDDVGHIVRLGLTVSEQDCSQIWNAPPHYYEGAEREQAEEVFETCNQYIGPFQPGIHTCDFTQEDCGNVPDEETGLGEPDNPDTSSRKRTSNVDRREPGELEAPPIPGKPDPSVPKVTLPPLVRELIEQLAPQKVPDDLNQRIPEIPDPQASPETLLDFLLTP